jgi:hypothetical protein
MVKARQVQSASFQYNIGLQEEYGRELRKLCRNMLKETTESLSKIYSKTFSTLLCGVELYSILENFYRIYDNSRTIL